MTSLAPILECVLSGQVPQEHVPALCKDNPGLGWLLVRQSRGTPIACADQTGRGASASPTQRASRPVDPFNLVSDPTLGHGLMSEKSRSPVKRVGLFSEFIRSALHLSSFPQQVWRK